MKLFRHPKKANAISKANAEFARAIDIQIFNGSYDEEIDEQFSAVETTIINPLPSGIQHSENHGYHGVRNLWRRNRPRSTNTGAAIEERDDVSNVPKSPWLASPACMFQEGCKPASESFEDRASGIVERDGVPVEQKALAEEEMPFGSKALSWEEAKLLADANMKAGCFIQALEMYLLSRDLLANHVENVSSAVLEDRKRSVKSILAPSNWNDSDILHSIGEIFYYLSKDAVSGIESKRKSSDKHRQQVKALEMLTEARKYLTDSCMLKQRILSETPGGHPFRGGLICGDFANVDCDPISVQRSDMHTSIKLELSSASTMHFLGKSNAGLGQLEEARIQYREARNQHLRIGDELANQQARGESCDPILEWENKRGLAVISCSCGDYFMASGDSEKALQAYIEGLGLFTSMQKTNTIVAPSLCRSGISTRYGNIVDYMVEVQMKIGETYFKLGKWRPALATLAQASNLLHNELKEKAASMTNTPSHGSNCSCKTLGYRIASRRFMYGQLHRCYTLCSKVYSGAGDRDESEKARTEADRIKKEALQEQGPEARDQLSVLSLILEHIGMHYEESHEDNLAFKSYRFALELMRGEGKNYEEHKQRLLKFWTQDETRDSDLETRLCRSMGMMLGAKSQYDSALDMYKEAFSSRIIAAGLNLQTQLMQKSVYFESYQDQTSNGLVKRRITISHHDRDFIKSLNGITFVLQSKASNSHHVDTPPAAQDQGNKDLTDSTYSKSLDILLQALFEAPTRDIDQSRSIAAVVLYRIGMALWKKDSSREDALTCMIKSLQQTIDDQDLGKHSMRTKKSDGCPQVNKADVLESIGCIHLELQNFEEAKMAYIGALQEQQAMLVKGEDQERKKYVARWKVARLSMKAGILHRNSKQLGMSEELLRNALQIIKRAKRSPLESIKTGVGNKTNGDYCIAMEADILHQLGLTYASQGDKQSASDAYNGALEALRGAGKTPEHSKIVRIQGDIKALSSITPRIETPYTKDDFSAGTSRDSTVHHIDSMSTLGSSEDWDEFDEMEELPFESMCLGRLGCE